MQTNRFTILIMLIVAAAAFVTPARADGPGGCPPWRPCGPGNSYGGNHLIGQGCYGADFRPTCATHDACLAAGVPRRTCDRQFLNHMNCACERSTHPLLCRMKAFEYFAAARLFGGLYY